MRTVRLPLALLLLGAAACQADSFPSAPNADIAGTYKLTTINGLALPFSFRPDSILTQSATDTSVHRETLYRDDYELLSTGRFRYTTVDSAVTHVTDGTADTKSDFSYVYVGSWQQQSNAVVLSADSVQIGNGAMTKLAQADVFAIPLPSGTGISGTASLSHESLGSGNVVVNYTFVYTKQ